MTRFRFPCRLILLAAGLVFTVPGDPVRARDFRPGLIPNGAVIDLVRGGCTNCHIVPEGGTARNPFGLEVEAILTRLSQETGQPISSGLQFWGPELAILDSDGDGVSNGRELQDAEGLWGPGDPPAGIPSLVSNPGNPTDFPPDAPAVAFTGSLDTVPALGNDIHQLLLSPGGMRVQLGAGGPRNLAEIFQTTSPLGPASIEQEIGAGDFSVTIELDPDSAPLPGLSANSAGFGLHLVFESALAETFNVLIGWLGGNQGEGNFPVAIDDSALELGPDRSGTPNRVTLTRQGEVMRVWESGSPTLEPFAIQVGAAIPPAAVLTRLSVFGLAENPDISPFPPTGGKFTSIELISPALLTRVNAPEAPGPTPTPIPVFGPMTVVSETWDLIPAGELPPTAQSEATFAPVAEFSDARWTRFAEGAAPQSALIWRAIPVIGSNVRLQRTEFGGGEFVERGAILSAPVNPPFDDDRATTLKLEMLVHWGALTPDGSIDFPTPGAEALAPYSTLDVVFGNRMELEEIASGARPGGPGSAGALAISLSNEAGSPRMRVSINDPPLGDPNLPPAGGPAPLQSDAFQLGPTATGWTDNVASLGDQVFFEFPIEGSQVVGSTSSAAVGAATMTVNTVKNTVTYHITIEDLAGIEIDAHVHGPGEPGVESFNIIHTMALGTTKDGVWNYEEDEEQYILGGLTYVQIHSVAYPSGEIRGQIVGGQPIPAGYTYQVEAVFLKHVEMLGQTELRWSIMPLDGGPISGSGVEMLQAAFPISRLVDWVALRVGSGFGFGDGLTAFEGNNDRDQGLEGSWVDNIGMSYEAETSASPARNWRHYR